MEVILYSVWDVAALKFYKQQCITYSSTVELGYLAHAPDESTTATCALDNGTRGLASSIILTRPLL